MIYSSEDMQTRAVLDTAAAHVRSRPHRARRGAWTVLSPAS